MRRVRVLASSLRKASIPLSCLIILSVSSHFHTASSLASPSLESVNPPRSHLLSALKPPRTKQGKAAVAVKDGKSPWEWRGNKNVRDIRGEARRSLASKVRWDRGWQRVIFWLTTGQLASLHRPQNTHNTRRNNTCTSVTGHSSCLPFYMWLWWKAFSHFKYTITYDTGFTAERISAEKLERALRKSSLDGNNTLTEIKTRFL